MNPASVNAVKTDFLIDCGNPTCNLTFEASGTAMQPRRFCSDRCRLNHWILRKAGAPLAPLGQAKAWAILKDLRFSDGTRAVHRFRR